MADSIFSFWSSRRGNVAAAEQTTTETNASEDYSYESQGNTFSLLFGETGSPPYSIKEIQNYVKHPQIFYKELRQLANWAYYANGTVTTAVDSLKSIYTLDSVIACATKKPDSKKTPANFKKNKERMSSTLKTIRHRQIIRDAIFKNANDGMYVAYFDVRKTVDSKQKVLTDLDVSNITEINELGVNATITTLPIDYVKIVGRRNNSYVVAFDLRYFRDMLQEERDRQLKAYPAEIRSFWRQYDDGKLNGDWIILDNDKTIVTKIKSEMSDPYGVPFAVAALDDVEYAQYFKNSKRKLLDSVNNQVIYEVYPEGQTKGTSSLSSKQQEEQHNVIKNALLNRKNRFGISFFSLAAGTKLEKVDVNTELLDEKNENGIKNDVNKGLGFSATALDGSSSGNYAATEVNLEVVAANVYTWIDDIVTELNKCINANIIKDSSCRVELYILPTTFVNRDKQVRYMKELYMNGKGSLIAWIASTGFNYEKYLSLMDYELEEDFENHYPVHKTSFNVRGEDAADSDIDQSGGRPVDDDATAASTMATRANGSNDAPKPST